MVGCAHPTPSAGLCPPHAEWWAVRQKLLGAPAPISMEQTVETEYSIWPEPMREWFLGNDKSVGGMLLVLRPRVGGDAFDLPDVVTLGAEHGRRAPEHLPVGAQDVLA